MPLSTPNSGATHPWPHPSNDASALSRFEKWLPTLLSIIAGMVDLTGFLSLGNLFTAHITGNLVVVGALVVRRGQINPAQILAIPVFILAVAATWLFAKASDRRGPGLRRLLLLVQFLLLTCVLIFSVITKPSANPHGLMAGIAAMMAISAMACQFALLRLTLPVAPSTAVMTGDTERFRGSLYLLIGFFGGCVVGAVAVSWLGDWAWSFPVALAGVAVML